MWTATLVQKEKTNGNLRLVLQYTDGVNIVRREYITNGQVPSGWLNQVVANDIKQLTNLDAYDAALALSAVSAAADPVPTQADIDQAQFFKDYNNWIDVKTKLVDTGVVPLSAAAVQNLLTAVKNELKASYIPLL